MLRAHDLAMSFLSRCADRLASAFVTETVTEDGTRLLLALDPSLHGLDVVIVTSEAELSSDWAVPDDLRELI